MRIFKGDHLVSVGIKRGNDHHERDEDPICPGTSRKRPVLDTVRLGSHGMCWPRLAPTTQCCCFGIFPRCRVWTPRSFYFEWRPLRLCCPLTSRWTLGFFPLGLSGIRLRTFADMSLYWQMLCSQSMPTRAVAHGCTTYQTTNLLTTPHP